MMDDPDNPPLTGREKWAPAAPHIQRKLAEHKTRFAARQMTWIQHQMWVGAIQHRLDQGAPVDVAVKAAIAAMNAPPNVPLPTLDEL